MSVEVYFVAGDTMVLPLEFAQYDDVATITLGTVEAAIANAAIEAHIAANSKKDS